MKKFKLKKEHLCTLATLIYHGTFLGGATTLGNYYLDEFEKTRQVIIQQVDRAENVVDKVRKTGDNLTDSVNKIDKELKKVRKACSGIRL
jgi:hypothetical protein